MDLQKNNNNNCRNYIKKSCNDININNTNNNLNGGQRKNGILQWTNERHSKFLSSMEANFVQNMLEKSSNSTITKLDRFVPDISESTLDLRTSEHLSNGVSRTCNNNKQIKTRMVRPSKMVHDQVVPQLEEKGGGKIEIDLNK